MMKTARNNLILFTLILIVSGCSQFAGPYYLKQKKYAEGVEVLNQQLKKEPDDANAAYYLGRYHLALKKPKTAMKYFETAHGIDPTEANYEFWKGITYWALNDTKGEQASYIKALQLDPRHLGANLYLGHTYYDAKEWQRSIAKYDTVLDINEYNSQALYFRAKAFGQLSQEVDEILAWKQYLKYYPNGTRSREAALRLNRHGDFTYRNFIIGKRSITLKSIEFGEGSNVLTPESKNSLHTIDSILHSDKQLILNIVVFSEGSASLARERAITVRNYITRRNPRIASKRLPLSWFGSAETIKRGKIVFHLDDSVNFITDAR